MRAAGWTMTSDPSPSECFVCIVLPGMVEPVTAGRFQLQSDRHGTQVGRFVYGRSYLERVNAVALDPVELRLTPRTYETVALNGVFGALRDAGPDYWGRRVIEKHAGKAQLSELDYLLQSADDRAGALGFGLNQQPPAPRRIFNQTVALEKLQRIADALIAEEDLPEDEANAQIQELMLLGTSMGGARPKVVVEDDDALWIAKFNRKDDRWNNARVEHAMLVLARNCGLNVADSKIVNAGGRDVLMVRRFDRERKEHGYARAHGQCIDAVAHRGQPPFARALVVSLARRRIASRLRGAGEKRPRTVPADVLQRADLQHGRSSTQSRRDRQRPGLEIVARL